MGEVRQFPTAEVAKDKLYSYTADLEEMYRALIDAHSAVNELELQAAELEGMFEVELQKFISQVGLGEVPIDILRYSGKMEDYIYEQKD